MTVFLTEEGAARMVDALKEEHFRVVAELKAEIERLHTRLEDNFAYQYDAAIGEVVCIAVEPGSIPDGIACRDETIRLLEARLAAKEARDD